MRILQLIDTLDAGGAERMAVNMANALSEKIEVSYLCATRFEGLLKEDLYKNVKYLFLQKKGTIDFKSFFRFYKFIKEEKIDIIHAHSSSFFLAVIVSLFYRKTKVIWHDHYGNSEYVTERPKRVLQLCSYFFSHSFAVNTALASWAKESLNHKSVSYLPNFVNLSNSAKLKTDLKGIKGKRIVCLANLRPQKDHINLLEAFNRISIDFPEYTLHCVGQDFDDAYSKNVYDLVTSLNLNLKVFFYGSCSDVSAILSKCDIGVLSSKSEGLPLALLEYGYAKLPVVVTNIGDCNKVVEDKISGLLVPSEQPNALSDALSKHIRNKKAAIEMGLNLNKVITNKFSHSAVIDLILEQYKTILTH